LRSAQDDRSASMLSQTAIAQVSAGCSAAHFGLAVLAILRRRRSAMKYIRVFADEAGESHFQEVEVAMTVSQMAGQSAPEAAAEISFYRLSAELKASPWHTSP